jgi:hypothetical protein
MEEEDGIKLKEEDGGRKEGGNGGCGGNGR